MEQFDNLIDDLFDNATKIPFSDVPFSSEVRTLCEQNMCGMYGKTWTCPPAVGPLEDLQSRLAQFSQVMIFSKVYPLADSFDWEGMQSGVKDFQARVLRLKKRMKKESQDLDYIALGAGACSICEDCTYGQQLPCRNPETAIVSVEACGIDVMTMMSENGMAYNNGANTVTYIGTVFY